MYILYNVYHTVYRYYLILYYCMRQTKHSRITRRHIQAHKIKKKHFGDKQYSEIDTQIFMKFDVRLGTIQTKTNFICAFDRTNKKV